LERIEPIKMDVGVPFLFRYPKMRQHAFNMIANMCGSFARKSPGKREEGRGMIRAWWPHADGIIRFTVSWGYVVW